MTRSRRVVVDDAESVCGLHPTTGTRCEKCEEAKRALAAELAETVPYYLREREADPYELQPR